MRFISFGLICLTSIVTAACVFDKGKDIDPAVTGNEAICDTSAVPSYSADISVIITDNCISCHGQAESVKLNDYANVQGNALATSGSIYGSVSRDGGAIPMPPNRSLSECDIQKIKKWTDAGAQNN
jgi:mono/diheme cytochrome c family protein